jgi:hypothetical protein
MSFETIFEKFVLSASEVNLITDMAKTDDQLMGMLIKLKEFSDDYGIQDMYMNKILNYIDDKKKYGLH